MSSIRMSEGMDGDTGFENTGALFGFAEGALDTGATHGGGRRRTLGVIAPGGGKEPGGMPMGFPVDAEQREGIFRQGDIPVFGTLPTMDMDLEARASAGRDLEAEGVMEPEAQAIDGREVDLVVHG